jgi:SAM-dependent methyltransferase
MLGRARALAAEAGIDNVEFVRADAQVHPFDAGAHDLVVSRFGAMFFADKVEAFTNLCAALRPGGRLVLVAWQDISLNEHFDAVIGALAAGRQLPSPPPGSPSPFGLADEQHGRQWLGSAGFVDVGYESVRAPIDLADTAADAHAFFLRSAMGEHLLADLEEGAREAASASLLDTLRDHETADGVVFDSAAWIITARRP